MWMLSELHPEWWNDMTLLLNNVFSTRLKTIFYLSNSVLSNDKHTALFFLLWTLVWPTFNFDVNNPILCCSMNVFFLFVCVTLHYELLSHFFNKQSASSCRMCSTTSILVITSPALLRTCFLFCLAFSKNFLFLST